jgi:hypothetical protein
MWEIHMPQSLLAEAFYQRIHSRCPASEPRITYKELVESLPKLPKPYEGLHWRDSRLDEALGELVTACHAHGLPAISAIVVNNETRAPGNAYYAVAHPGVTDPFLREIEWGREYDAARKSTYPASLR